RQFFRAQFRFVGAFELERQVARSLCAHLNADALRLVLVADAGRVTAAEVERFGALAAEAGEAVPDSGPAGAGQVDRRLAGVPAEAAFAGAHAAEIGADVRIERRVVAELARRSPRNG